MLRCLEEARRYKKCGSYDSQWWHSNCKRIYVVYMTPIIMENIEFPTPFCSPHQNFRKKFLPPICPVLNPGYPPLQRGGGGNHANSSISRKKMIERFNFISFDTKIYSTTFYNLYMWKNHVIVSFIQFARAFICFPIRNFGFRVHLIWTP